MKQFVIFILLNFSLLSFSFSKADPLSYEISPHGLEQAVWNIHDLGHSGTGFFIGPSHLVTNFHVAFGLFIGNIPDSSIINILNNLEDPIALRQGGEKKSLFSDIKILAVSAIYDLALLEIKRPVTDYLRLREDPLESGENLF